MEQMADPGVGRRGGLDHSFDDSGEFDQAELVSEPEGAVFGAEQRGQQEQAALGVISLAGIAKFGRRHDARRYPPRFLEPAAERFGDRQRVGERAAERLGGLFELGEMVAMLLDVVAHPIFGSHEGAGIAIARQRRVAVDFLERTVEPRDRIGDRGGVQGDFGELVARDPEVAEHRIRKNLGEIVGAGARPAGRSESADVDLVMLGEAKEQSGGDRALVALEVVQIGRADRQARRHVGLRQSAVAAETAKTRSKEEFRVSHRSKLSTSLNNHKSICDNRTTFAEAIATEWSLLSGNTQLDSLKDRQHDKF